MTSFHGNKKAYLIPEILIAALIISLMSAFIFSAYRLHVKTLKTSDNIIELSQTVDRARNEAMYLYNDKIFSDEHSENDSIYEDAKYQVLSIQPCSGESVSCKIKIIFKNTQNGIFEYSPVVPNLKYEK